MRNELKSARRWSQAFAVRFEVTTQALRWRAKEREDRQSLSYILGRRGPRFKYRDLKKGSMARAAHPASSSLLLTPPPSITPSTRHAMRRPHTGKLVPATDRDVAPRPVLAVARATDDGHRCGRRGDIALDVLEGNAANAVGRGRSSLLGGANLLNTVRVICLHHDAILLRIVNGVGDELGARDRA